MQNRIYAVKRGRKPGIYFSIKQCEKQTKGYPFSEYKRFKNLKDAEDYLNTDEQEGIRYYTNKSKKEFELTTKLSKRKEAFVIYVDGSYYEDKYSYGFVVIKNNKVIYSENGYGKSAVGLELKNVAGELLAVEKAIQYAEKHRVNNVHIFHDCSAAQDFLKVKNEKNRNVFALDYKNFIFEKKFHMNIDFIQVKGHTGNYFNMLADYEAREALGINYKQKCCI